VELSDQITTFAITVITGAILGALFDLYRVIKTKIRFRPLITAVTDILYWLTATVIVFAALLLGNWGELRLYVFIGLITGVTIYYRLFSRYVIRFLAGIFYFTGIITRWICLTFACLWRWLYTIINFLLLKPVIFICKQLLKPVMGLYRKIYAGKKPDDPPGLPK